ncbi:MAG TPA: glycosyltransferase family 4 protein [Flavitalea sp.]|nr:glycosyltransferase family 4 protein [Flavitalea sp.]
MKVLWLSPSPAGLSAEVNFNFPGGGWITSLENNLKQIPEIELAVCFFHYLPTTFRILHDDVTYYPVYTDLFSLKQKIRSRFFLQLADTNTEGILKAIEDFKPDVIQVFGTEFGLGEIAEKTNIPLIIHIQGLLNPIYAAWLPPGISLSTIHKHASWKNKILRGGFYHDYKMMEKRAAREERIIKRCDNFFGRTLWDKSVISIYKKTFNYFHCDEMLRSEFYRYEWKMKRNKIIRLVTTINESMYKGLEIVLQTAYLLKSKANISFEWNIVGMQPGSELAQLIEKITGLRFQDQCIRFLGPRIGDDLLKELLNADLFIHPSYIDNSPNSVCEAQLLGMPVIAGRVGGIPTLVNNEETGILYNSNDPFELSSIIKDLPNDTPLIKKISRQARAIALKRHNYETITTTVLNTYQMMIKKECKEVLIQIP